MQLDSHSAVTLVSTFPIISFPVARQKIIHGDFRTVGKRNAENQLEIFLCTPSGRHIAIVDFESGEVRR